jgi:hypothetical protein
LVAVSIAGCLAAGAARGVDRYREICWTARSLPNYGVVRPAKSRKPIASQLIRFAMAMLKYIYWQEENMWLGYLEEYPDYMTQA